MNQKPKRVFANENFRQETLSFESVPHQSQIFLDFQTTSAKVKKFYPEKETALKDFAALALSNYKIDRQELCEILIETNKSFGAREKTFENIELLRQKDCLTIVTGQQAGLFSGAVYTIYKALSAIKLADDLRRQNIKAVPVFWIAEEDHDFDEVKKTYVLDKEGKLAEFENVPDEYTANLPVGFVKLDQKINFTINDLLINLPHTEYTEEIKTILSESYCSGETYSDAFARLLAKLFADYGLIVLSPLNEKLKKLCAPLFAEAVEKSGEIVSALLDKDKELEKHNYQPQVLVAENSFPFFFQNPNGARQAMRFSDDSTIKIQNSKIEFNKTDLVTIARDMPQRLSPNALMRPVVQDYLLPTLVYFGGAAEIAYFAQNSAIYKTLNRPVTPIRHRASLTIVEAKHRRTLEKYNLRFKDLFGGEEKIHAEIVEKYLNRTTADVFDEAEKTILEQLKRIEKSLAEDEPTLAANSANRKKKILWHIAALRKKYHHAEILKNDVARRRIENLFASILPNSALQERTLNVVTFLNLYGTNFINWIYEATDGNEKKHQILYM
jgi:bacillithiol biosynthesis cysteine-adding enzyme BshC